MEICFLNWKKKIKIKYKWWFFYYFNFFHQISFGIFEKNFKKKIWKLNQTSKIQKQSLTVYYWWGSDSKWRRNMDWRVTWIKPHTSVWKKKTVMPCIWTLYAHKEWLGGMTRWLIISGQNIDTYHHDRHLHMFAMSMLHKKWVNHSHIEPNLLAAGVMAGILDLKLTESV